MIKVLQGWERCPGNGATGDDPAVGLNVAVVDKCGLVYGILDSGNNDDDSYERNLVLDEGDTLVAWKRWGRESTDPCVPDDRDTILFASYVEFDKTSKHGCYYKLVRTSNYTKGKGVCGRADDAKWRVPCSATARLATIGLGDKNGSEAGDAWIIARGGGTANNCKYRVKIDTCDHLLRRCETESSDICKENLTTADKRFGTRTLGPGKAITLSIDCDEENDCTLASSYVCFFVKELC